MALTGVEAATPRELARATEVARVLDVPLVAALARRDAGVRIVVTAAGLSLAFEDRARGKPFAVDLTEIHRRPPLARNHIFRRALGSNRVIIDATAGFGQDTVRALGLGCEVTAVERSPVVFALLEDAVARARADSGLNQMLDRLHLAPGDAAEYLGTRRPDLVYLDPMFTKLKSTAKSPKEMQLLQELLGEHDPGDEVRLFDAALSAARVRVVVKRALKARVDGPPPSHSFRGQSVRYDVYQKT